MATSHKAFPFMVGPNASSRTPALHEAAKNIRQIAQTGRNRATPSLNDKSQRGLLSLQQTRGNAALLRPDVVYNAASSPDADIFGTRNANANIAADYFNPSAASSNVANLMKADEAEKENLKLPGSGESTGQEAAKSAYGTAMRNIKNKKTTADRPWGSENTVKYGTDQEISMRQASNQLFGGDYDTEQQKKAEAEAAEAANAKSKSPEEAAAEAYGQDTTASVIDPTTGQAIPYSDLTLAGQQLAADDYAGHAAAQYLYGTEGLYDKYGDDWSKFQREGTYDEWQAALSDPRMAQYFTNITTDKDFLDENGNFDFDKYWQHAVTLDAMNTPELSDRDFALVYGDSSGVLNANNMWRRDMMQNSPAMYGLSIDTNAEYPAEYQQYLNSLAQGENAPIYQDENGNMYYNGFGDNGLNNDQLLSLLNMQTMQDAMMTYGTPDAYSLNEANMLANMPGWNTTYSDEAAEGYSNNYGMPENFDLKTYNPYALNPNQLYYMLNGGDQVYDPTGYIMNEYMNTPAGLYYIRNS